MTANQTMQGVADNPQALPAAPLVEVHFELDCDAAQAFGDALMQCGALSVDFTDAHANTEHEQELFGEPGFEDDQFLWALNRVSALFRNEYEARTLVQEAATLVQSEHPKLAAAMLAVCAQALHCIPVAEQDWVRLTQSQFDPIAIHPKLIITPSWHANRAETSAQANTADTSGPKGSEAIRMILDPGLAFGTGTHPTTALCLRWLCEHPLNNKTVLDYGCGSGILAIAAMQLGAKHGLAVDIDPQALISTQYNAHNNGVELDLALPDAMPTHLGFDVVVANILSGPLKVLAPLLCSKVRPQGALVLSGILERQAEELMACYAPWLPMKVWGQQEGWVCLVGYAS